MTTDGALRAFIDDVRLVVGSTDDEHEITRRVGERLSALLDSGYRLPSELTRPSSEHHVNYPLHIDPDSGWALAARVWDTRPRTPPDRHETVGGVGLHAGGER